MDHSVRSPSGDRHNHIQLDPFKVTVLFPVSHGAIEGFPFAFSLTQDPVVNILSETLTSD